MAMLISRATGNFTAAATWGVADNATGSQLTNPSASTNTTTSYVYSSTFTGTNTRVADGIVLFLKRLNTTGTVTVALSDDNGVTATREVTVNASDLLADESWVFFKFGTTLTLDGGTDYRVGVKASSADNALIYRNATAGNWARMVSTTTTGAPAAGDTMLIVGEWTGAGASSSYTVTMNNTNSATDFGTNSSGTNPSQTNPGPFSGVQIGQNGTLNWDTSNATNYYLKVSGNVIVWSGGTYNMGTSGTPCPRDSTMTLELDTFSQSASGVFGFCGFNGASISIYGQSRTAGKDIVKCNLSADAAAGATSLTVNTDTGWLDNDEIAIASTSRTNTEGEFGTLNGAAGASTLTVDGFAGTAGGLAFAHSGTSPTQAEIINLTRNVVIRTTTTSADTRPSYVVLRNIASGNFYWCQFLGMISSSPTFSVVSTTAITFQYCAFTYLAGTSGGQLVFATLNGTISNCCFSRNTVLSVTTHPCSFTNNTVICNTSLVPISLSIFGNTIAYGNSVSGGSNGFTLTLPQTQSVLFGSNSFGPNVAHSNAGNGITLLGSQGLPTDVSATLNNFMSWRNNSGGASISVTHTLILNNGTFFGNAVNIGTSTTAAQLATFNNCLMAGDTSFSSASGLSFTQNSAIGGQFTFNNCQFSPTSGIYVPHTTADINLANAGVRPMITLNNTLLGATIEVSNPQNLSISGFVKSSKHDQTEGAFKSWFSGGVIERDTTIFNTAAPSERLTPISATTKLASGPRLVAVDDGGTITINAYVRKSATGDGAAYNGNQPRLMVRANLACGITTDTVLDTMTVGAGTWEQLTGTTAAVDADGALEFYVDCDGTAGWINIDDWTVA